MKRVIWQYWETRGTKPAFIEGLYRIACANAGVPVVRVTPETLTDYLPDLPAAVHAIEEIAHKADIIRARLVARYGGMWLDSDALVMGSLADLFTEAEGFAFLGFNDSAQLTEPVPPNVRVNCFLAPAASPVVATWADAQTRLLETRGPTPQFRWTEIGTELLDPACLAHRDHVRLRPFSEVCPVPWNQLPRFDSDEVPSNALMARTRIVMLSNKALEWHYPSLREKSVEEMGEDLTLLGQFVRRAKGV